MNPVSPASALSPEAASAPPLLSISCSLHEAIGQLLCHIKTRSTAHLLAPRSQGAGYVFYDTSSRAHAS
ncbi:hypothetical protein EJB05_35152 [Eragrostis curvula]|uniref:Uncharacterized protein n=1 Tax=Eragrostis curvula TaxID=38414 RepID=A0A5J9U6C8_9POAL|nr:hypothetical protein EJB05_35152 [Eragrostis curvula]